ncbi:MAG: OstA-like protein, partial [Bacteroidota bacterium]|nr:OstA-like protein [Bacteroidota bacterium]
MSKHLHFIFFLFLTHAIGYGQETKKVDIRQAASFEVNEKLFPGAKILKSNAEIRVHLHHDGMDIWSDVAYFYETENTFEAEGYVVVKQGDSLELNSEYIEYSGTTKLAIAKHKVELENYESILRTDSLFFDRQKQEVYYQTTGEITSEDTVIRSKSGTYVVDDKKYEFISDVGVTDPSFTIFSQRMDYYTDVRHAYFYGATTI